MSPTEYFGNLNTQSQANPFLLTFNGAIAQSQLYEPDNKILLEPIKKLTEGLRELLREEPVLTLQSRDQSVFVNDRRLRCVGQQCGVGCARIHSELHGDIRPAAAEVCQIAFQLALPAAQPGALRDGVHAVCLLGLDAVRAVHQQQPAVTPRRLGQGRVDHRGGPDRIRHPGDHAAAVLRLRRVPVRRDDQEWALGPGGDRHGENGPVFLRQLDGHRGRRISWGGCQDLHGLEEGLKGRLLLGQLQVSAGLLDGISRGD